MLRSRPPHRSLNSSATTVSPGDPVAGRFLSLQRFPARVRPKVANPRRNVHGGSLGAAEEVAQLCGMKVTEDSSQPHMSHGWLSFLALNT